LTRPRPDPRLLGTWCSDKALTLAEWSFSKKTRAKGRRIISGLFGKFRMRYTPSRIYAELGGHRTVTPYKVVSADPHAVVILRFIEDGATEFQRVHFMGPNLHWVSVGRNREFFRRTRPNTSIQRTGRKRRARSPAVRSARR
jgi:hypothetical protein